MSSEPIRSEPTHLPLTSEEIGAIAVDTNVYREYGFRFRSQPLSTLPEVHRLGVAWLIPEFWENELKRHLLENATKAANLQRALTGALDWADRDQMPKIHLLQQALSQESTQQISDRLLNEHLGSGKPIRLDTAWSAGPKVLGDYFSARHPFETTGSKKSEFPDAFALATLSAWGKKNNKKILVVTSDQGCLRACEAAEYLIGERSLTTALASQRTASERRKEVIHEYERLLAEELSHPTTDIRRAIDAEIERELWNLDFEVNYEEKSGQNCEYEITEVELENVEPVRAIGIGADVRVFSATVGELIFVCYMCANIEVSAYFVREGPGTRHRSFQYSAPRENTSGTIELEVIATLQPIGSLSASTLPHSAVRRIELKVQQVDVDFGKIEAYDPRID